MGDGVDGGGLVDLLVPSALLGEDVRVVVLLPPAACAEDDLPWLYVLHGRQGSAAELRPLLRRLGDAMHAGRVRRHVVVAPDAPWLDRAGWWVDSLYAPRAGAGDGVGPPPGGRPVETVMLTEVRPALEQRWRAPGAAAQRRVAGISMGGAAALRWLLVHPDLFGAAALLSPATYAGPPPVGSSAFASGAFGVGDQPYVAERYRELCDYGTLLARRPADPAPARVVIVTGDGEPAQHAATGEWADLDLAAARLHAALKRAPNVASRLRVVAGGHDPTLWEQHVEGAVRLLDDPSEDG